MSDVAREAEVAEQTIYNYLGTKEQLIIDRDEQIQDRLVDLIRNRPRGVTPAAAIREFVLSDVDAIRRASPVAWRGELGYLATTSQGIALAGVFHIIITTAGRRTQQGRSPEEIADELRPVAECLLGELDRWLTKTA